MPFLGTITVYNKSIKNRKRCHMKKFIRILKHLDSTTICVYICGIAGIIPYIASQIIYSPVVNA